MRAVTVVGRAQQGVEGAARKQVVAYYKGEIMTANRIRINWIYKIYFKKRDYKKGGDGEVTVGSDVDSYRHDNVPCFPFFFFPSAVTLNR